jgi:hypothetical protein
VEVILRPLTLKQVRNWSYETHGWEVQTNLVYQSFGRIGTEKVVGARTMGRMRQAVGSDVLRDSPVRSVERPRQSGPALYLSQQAGGTPTPRVQRFEDPVSFLVGCPGAAIHQRSNPVPVSKNALYSGRGTVRCYLS